MEFPLYHELSILVDIHQIIPSDKMIDFDVRKLTQKQIDLIERYAIFCLDQRVTENDFQLIKLAAKQLDALATVFNQYDLIIAPGDSPAKYINAIQLAQISIPPVIQIPLSGLGDPVKFTDAELEMIYVYINEFLQVYGIQNINPERIAIFDQISTGMTYLIFTGALNKILGVNIVFPIIPTPSPGWSHHTDELLIKRQLVKIDAIKDPTRKEGKLRGALYTLMQEGQQSYGRCLPSYKIIDFGQPPKSINATNCNVISVLVALAYHHRLLPVEIPTIDVPEGTYRGTYYNINNKAIETGAFYLETYSNMAKIIDSNEPQNLIRLKIPALAVIKIENQLYPADIKSYENQLVKAQIADGGIFPVYVYKETGYMIRKRVTLTGCKIINKYDFRSIYRCPDKTEHRVIKLGNVEYIYTPVDKNYIIDVLGEYDFSLL